MSDEKAIRLNRAKQDVRDATGLSMEKVDALFGTGTPMQVLFDTFYAQVESITANQLADGRRAEAAESKRDVADMRAQQYFVRLRDAGLLKEGESY